MRSTCLSQRPERGAQPFVVQGKADRVSASLSVWLVDDNDDFRDLMSDLLRRQEGIQCARDFASPDELLSTLASRVGPDVILLDVQMGDRNGLDAVRPIKSLNKSTRVLMFTTCYDPEYYERALAEGASDYILKSEPFEQVVERIRQSAPERPRRRWPPKTLAKSAVEVVPVKMADSGGGTSWSRRPLTKTLEFLRSLWN